MVDPSRIDTPADPGPPSGRSTAPGLQEGVCVFRLGAQRYAVPSACVLEVAPADKLLPVALTPDWIVGLHNLRGRPLGVVDLERVLGGPAAPATPRGALTLLVVRMAGLTFAIAIDRVEALLGAAEAAQAAPAGVAEHPAVSGVLAREDGGAVTVLDADEIAARLRRRDEPTQAGPEAA